MLIYYFELALKRLCALGRDKQLQREREHEQTPSVNRNISLTVNVPTSISVLRTKIADSFKF